MTDTPAIRRKFAYIGAGWTAGLLICLQLGTAAGVCVPASLAAAAVLHARLSKDKPGQRLFARRLILIAVSAAAGGLFLAAYTRFVYEPVTALRGQSVTIEGTVTAVDPPKRGSTAVTIKGRVSGARTKVMVYTRGDVPDCGDRVRADLKASASDSEYSSYADDRLRSLGIFISGSGNIIKTGGRNELLRAAAALRERALGSIYENCDKDSGAFIASILCSDKTELSQKTRDDIYRAGIGHLFAVSGTHMIMLYGLLTAVLGRLIPVFRLRNILIGAVLALFAVFAGGSVSVIRACIMTGISLFGAIVFRKSDTANSLGLAAFVITLGNPFAVTSVSFGLSFTAAAAIGILSPELVKDRTDHPAVKYLISCLCVNVLTMPICAVSFDTISLISALSNIVLIPLCTVCLYLAMIFTATGCIFTPLIHAADLIAGFVGQLCGLVTAVPYTYAAAEPVWVFAAWGVTASALFTVFAAVKKRGRADLWICTGAYLLICLLAAAMQYI